jgi:hypothetical protein
MWQFSICFPHRSSAAVETILVTPFSVRPLADICCILHIVTDVSASEESVSQFRSPSHFSSSGSYPLDMSALGDPTGCNATAGLAYRVAETHKSLFHGKAGIQNFTILSILLLYSQLSRYNLQVTYRHLQIGGCK